MTECYRCPPGVGDPDAPLHRAVHDITRYVYDRPPTTAPAAAPQSSPNTTGDGVAAGAGGGS